MFDSAIVLSVMSKYSGNGTNEWSWDVFSFPMHCVMHYDIIIMNNNGSNSNKHDYNC